MKKIVLISLFLLSLRFYSQTQKLETVSFNLSTKSFDATLPFDIDFKIQGNTTPSIRKILFSYRAVTPLAHPSFPGDAASTTEVEWVNATGTETLFALPVGPLHPNTPYKFTFKFLYAVGLNPDQKAALNKDLANILKTSFFKEDIGQTEINKAIEAIQERIEDEVVGTGTVTDIHNNPVSISPTDPILKPVTDEIMNLSGKISTNKANIIAKCNTLIRETTALTIGNTFNAINAQTYTLNLFSQGIYNGALNPVVKDYSTVTTAAIGAFFINAMARPQILEDLFNGKANISGTSVATYTALDISSVRLLLSFFKTITAPTFANKNNQPVFPNDPNLVQLIANLQALVDLMDEANALQAKVDVLKDAIPDILKNKVISRQFIAYESPEIDITTDKNPYIGLDAGLVCVPKLQGVFISQGANFYLIPVNKKVPVSKFACGHGRRFARRFSLYLGITQKVAGPIDENYKALFSDAGSLLYGVGWRFTKVFRVGVGGLLFQYKDSNPVISKYNLRTTPMFSFSIDIDVVKAFGDFGKLIGLIKT